MQALEKQAAKVLVDLGYETVIVSTFVRNCRYIAFNLAASRRCSNGTLESLMVKIRISLHPIRSLAEAAVFCRDEIAYAKRYFTRKTPGERPSGFEVWVAVPVSSRFQQFRIASDGIYEIRPDGWRYCAWGCL